MKHNPRIIRLADLAKELGITPTAVSYALSPKWKERRISPATRERVLKLAEKRDYLPNAAAVSLRTNRTRTIGMLEVGVGSSIVEIFQGLEESMGEEYAILVGTSHHSVERELRILKSFDARGIDGLIVYATSDPETTRFLQKMVRRGMPIVQIDRHSPGLKASIVEPDNELIGRLCTRHLIDFGHRRIAFIRSSFVNSNTRDRARGYELEMKEAGLTPRFFPQDLTAYPHESAQYIGKALSSMKPPFGIVAKDAEEVIVEAEKMGLKCPQDVSVCSVIASSDPTSSLLRITPTVVKWSYYQMGVSAGRLLLRRILEGTKVSLEHIKLPADLHVGTSTMPVGKSIPIPHLLKK